MRTPNNGFKKTYPERSGMLALLICHGCQPDTACGDGAFRHIPPLTRGRPLTSAPALGRFPAWM